MSEEDFRVRTVESDSPEMAEMIGVMNLIQAGIAPYRQAFPDNPEHFYSIVFTAASSLIGTLFSEAVAIGIMKPQDKRRFVESMGHNIREGIQAGAVRAARIEREMTGGSVQ